MFWLIVGAIISVLVIMFLIALLKVAKAKSTACPNCERKIKLVTTSAKCPFCKAKLFKDTEGNYKILP